MKLDPKLTEFNRRFAIAVRDVFAADITAEQAAGGELIFRDHDQRAHVAIHLEPDVHGALDFATPLVREMMIRRLIYTLAHQIRTQYDGDKVGQLALPIVGTSAILQG